MMAEHGTNACYNEGCRRPECTAAHRDVQRHQRRMVAYGRWDPWIPADRVRAHVRGLMAQGVPFRRTAHEAGVSHWTVERLLYGDSAGPPPKNVRKDTGLRLLAVQATAELVSDVVSVDSTGAVPDLGDSPDRSATRDNVLDLLDAGESVEHVAARVGVSVGYVRSVASEARRGGKAAA